MYYDYALSLNPSSYFRLSEAAGNFVDSIGVIAGTPNGTLTRNVTSLLRDDTNGACQFDGTTAYITCGNVYHFNGNTSFSVTMVVKPTSFAAVGKLIDKANRWGLWINATNGLVTFFRSVDGTTSHFLSATSPLVLNAVNLIVATYDGATMRLYVNGAAAVSVASSLSVGVDTVPLTLGRYAPSGSQYYAGVMDEVGLYQYIVITDAQRLELWKQLRYYVQYPTAYTDYVLGLNPSSYWRLSEASGSFIDAGQAALHGTANGTLVRAVPGLLLGDDDEACDFDGASGYISTAAGYGLPSTFSILAWIRPDVFTDALRIIDKSNMGPSGWTVRLYLTSGQWLAQRHDGTAADACISSAAVPLSLTSGNMVLATYDGTNLRVYTNDSPVITTVASSRVMGTNAFGVTIGRLAGIGANYFNGVIDEVAIFGGVITDAQRLDLYRIGSTLYGGQDIINAQRQEKRDLDVEHYAASGTPLK